MFKDKIYTRRQPLESIAVSALQSALGPCRRGRLRHIRVSITSVLQNSPALKRAKGTRFLEDESHNEIDLEVGRVRTN